MDNFRPLAKDCPSTFLDLAVQCCDLDSDKRPSFQVAMEGLDYLLQLPDSTLMTSVSPFYQLPGIRKLCIPNSQVYDVRRSSFLQESVVDMSVHHNIRQRTDSVMHIISSTRMNTLSNAELPIPVVCIIYVLSKR